MALALLVAAGAAWQAYGRGGARPLRYRTIDAGPVELGAPIAKATRRQRTLDTILGAGRATIPARREVVVVGPGPRSSAGYALRVVAVTEERRRVVVRVRELTPHLGQPTRAVVTYPYRLIMIPATAKAVTVRFDGR